MSRQQLLPAHISHRRYNLPEYDSNYWAFHIQRAVPGLCRYPSKFKVLILFRLEGLKCRNDPDG